MNIGPSSLPLAALPPAALLFGLLLVAAIVGGYVARLVRLPRVIGYLAAGALARVALQAALRGGPDPPAELEAAAHSLGAVKDLALGLILFSIGAVFEARHLRAAGRGLLRMLLAEAGLAAALVLVGTAAVGLLLHPEVPAPVMLSFALLLGLAAIATAPAATLFTLREYEAKGPLSETILGLTGANNVLCIVVFHACFLLLAAGGALGPVTVSGRDLWLGLALSTLGSALLGGALGFVVSVAHAKLRLAETLLILVAAFIVLGAGEQWLLEHLGASYNFLLSALCLGAVFANVAIDPERLDRALATLGQPVFVGFFVLAGYSLRLEELAGLRAIGLTYVLCRLAGKVAGGWWAARGAAPPGRLSPGLGAGLLCQAAVIIGLADFVRSHWLHDWAARSFATTVLGSVVVFELCGPLLIKWLVVRAGEVKALSLFRHNVPPAAEGDSILALSAQALLRTLGLGRRPARTAAPESLQVRNIMRTNIKCVRADARLDEVLHFVEQSRYNHFPVVHQNDELVGVIHFSDIRGIIYDPALSDLVTALDLANPDTQAVPVNMSLPDLLAVFQAGDVGSLPVVESAGSRRVVGIVEQRDLLRALRLARGPAADI